MLSIVHFKYNVMSAASDSDDDNPVQTENHHEMIQQSFIMPLQLLMQRPGFPNLLCLNKILFSLAVTSCSVEYAMNHVHIVKTRLRTTVKDNWFGALLIHAIEKDVVYHIPIDSFISGYAETYANLAHLLKI
jgi:hypothetical protein